MKNIILRYGLIAGVIVSVLMGFNIILIKNPDYMGVAEIFGYASMLIALSGVFVGVRKYRDEYNGGSITFLQALKIGILITVIASIIYVISWAVLSELFMPDFHAKYGEYYLDSLRNNNASEAEISKATEQMKFYQEKFKNPLFRWGMSFLEIFPVGLVISLLAAVVHRRK